MADGIDVNFAAAAHQRDEAGQVPARNVTVHGVMHAGEAGRRECCGGHD